MIVHICCSVDSWYFLERIKEKYPNERLIGFFYNPNIFPIAEYKTRLIDAKRCCERLGIWFVEGEYDDQNWLKRIEGLENEPERGIRCDLCFDLRMEKTAECAVQNGETLFTTTLLMSPKKKLGKLQDAMQRAARRYSIGYVFEDFRKNGGTQAQFALARQMGAYFQDYCGCAFALAKERLTQNRAPHELSSPIDRAPSASERRLEIYSRRHKMEKEGARAVIVKTRFLNYRIFYGTLMDETGEAIPCEIAPYSAGKLDFLATLAPLSASAAFCVQKPLFVIAGEYADARKALGLSPFDLTPIFIVQSLPSGRVRVRLNAAVWEDVEEKLIVQ
ncbi:MAG: epoxyqueuosine reductase QueH [Helicobacteraceae bacterium]|jgi:predicted adenine nucleotide alpha hydrolase (AANH) superfamily ATPase|nr:epoxyqueuosine reductase QueH [Helicobacteraceae bacterium]